MRRLKSYWVVIAALAAVAVLTVTFSGRRPPLRNLVQAVIRNIPFRIPGVAPCPGCNILIINLDTLRAAELPCLGYFRNTTPNLCAFAKDNIMFSRFYSQSSFTLDSHTSIFTGLYPKSHHVIDALKDDLNREIPTLPEMLKKDGYRTIWAGITNDINLPLKKGMGRGYDEIHDLDGNSETWESEYGKLLTKFTEGKPTYMFLHSYGVHAPYLAGREKRQFIGDEYPNIAVTENEFQVHSRPYYEFVISEFRDRLRSSNTEESKKRNGEIVESLTAALRDGNLDRAREITWTFPEYENFEMYFAWYYKQVNPKDPKMVSYIQGLYDERIFQIDSKLTTLFRFLNREDIRKNTIVIILSDNGEEFMDHDYFDHAWNIYENSVHVPFIMAAPKTKRGLYHELGQEVDIVPTLLDLVGVPTTATFDGISLRSIVEGRGAQHIGQRYLIGNHRGDDVISIRNERWKMYKNNTKEKKHVELYDLMTDPGEQRNVLGDHLPIARLLDQSLETILAASPKYASVSGEFPGWIDDQKRQKLIDSGYF